MGVGVSKKRVEATSEPEHEVYKKTAVKHGQMKVLREKCKNELAETFGEELTKNFWLYFGEDKVRGKNKKRFILGSAG